jgi:hypothetical protein
VRDLLVIVPSRGRPERLHVTIEACLSLSEADTDIAVGIDLDDAETYAASFYGELGRRPRVIWYHGARRTLSGWTNYLASEHAGRFRAFASLGDDHVPRTQGWDRLLLEALDKLGGEGIAYGNDLHQGNALPTAPVISAGIVEALGWMMLPSAEHMFVDNAWRDLGMGAGCLAYVPEVVIEHVHPDAGKAGNDVTYEESVAKAAEDRAAYWAWRVTGDMASDIAKVRALLGRAP